MFHQLETEIYAPEMIRAVLRMLILESGIFKIREQQALKL